MLENNDLEMQRIGIEGEAGDVGDAQEPLAPALGDAGEDFEPQNEPEDIEDSNYLGSAAVCGVCLVGVGVVLEIATLVAEQGDPLTNAIVALAVTGLGVGIVATTSCYYYFFSNRQVVNQEQPAAQAENNLQPN